MLQFDIQYSTNNEYENPVKEGMYEFNVIPFENDFVKVKSESFWNSLGKQGFKVQNNLGFDAYRIRLEKTITSFKFEYNANVMCEDINPFDFRLYTADQEKALAYEEDVLHKYYFFLKNTASTQLDRESGFKIKKDEQTNFEFLQELNAYLRNNIKFDPSKTSLEKTPDQTLKDGSGVCQDFVNLFIGICRNNQIPARYVSGYLHQGAGYQGDALMHAWAEAYLPGVGWKGFDPTNNLLTDHHFIKVCHGYDYQDTAPIKGVLNTSGKNITNYAVQVNMQQ